MNNSIVGALRAIAFGCAAFFSLPSHADWVVSTDLAAIRPSPEAYALQPQNPPSFTWSRAANATTTTTYTLEISQSGQSPVTYVTTRNWFMPTKALASGTYTWRVKASNSTIWSTSRGFVINPSSTVFEVPENDTLRANVMAHARPRALPSTFVPYSAWTSAMITERSASLKDLTNDVLWHLGEPPLKESDWPLTSSGTTITSAFAAQQANIRYRLNRTTHQVEVAALAYRITGEQKYLDEAIKRCDELAALNPSGATSFVNQDQGSKIIAFTLAKAMDMLHGKIDATRVARWHDIVRVRTAEIFVDLAGSNGRLDQYPFDSHGASALGYVALIAALELGEYPEATEWFNYCVRNYIHSFYPWSGAEGGFSQGTYYAQATLNGALQLWDALGEAIGVNLYDKPWSKGFANFIAQFVPPGQPVHVFGDGHEYAPYAPDLKAYMSRFATPAARWYYENTLGYQDPLTILTTTSPLAAKRAPYPQAPANAAVFPSTGFVAMHSNLADPMRTSLYMRSSPYGSYSHSHGDHNGIVLFSGGKVLLAETGWYDYYGSPLSNEWYRQTKAHNAITFDSGKGQPVDGNTINLRRTGKITAFSTTSALDYTEGDATQAYDGLLLSAIRKVWYMRGQDQIVVHDKLASLTARSFEWNFHALMPIVAGANGSATITNGDRKLCLRPLTAGTTMLSRAGATPKAGTTEYHSAFVLPSATTAEFLILLDVGCKNPPVSLSTTATGRTLKVGTQTITLPR